MSTRPVRSAVLATCNASAALLVSGFSQRRAYRPRAPAWSISHGGRWERDVDRIQAGVVDRRLVVNVHPWIACLAANLAALAGSREAIASTVTLEKPEPADQRCRSDAGRPEDPDSQQLRRRTLQLWGHMSSLLRPRHGHVAGRAVMLRVPRSCARRTTASAMGHFAAALPEDQASFERPQPQAALVAGIPLVPSASGTTPST